MKQSRIFMALAFLGLFMGSCRTMSPEFHVKVIDNVSRSPLSGVTVKYRETHWASGTKDIRGETNFVMGDTDSKGMIGAERLNLYSRTNLFDLSRDGYWKVYLSVRDYERQFEVLVYYENAIPDKVLGTYSPDITIPISESTVVEVPMRRK